MWINRRRATVLVKYHFIASKGRRCLPRTRPTCWPRGDYQTRDLFQAIQQRHPGWTLNVQIMPFEDAKTYPATP